MDPGGGQSVELVGSVIPKGFNAVNIGDLIALGGALTYSLYVFRIGAFTKTWVGRVSVAGVEIPSFWRLCIPRGGSPISHYTE